MWHALLIVPLHVACTADGTFSCGMQREAMLVSTITGRPGTLRQFVSMALPPGTQMNITELRHRCFCHCMVVLKLNFAAHQYRS